MKKNINYCFLNFAVCFIFSVLTSIMLVAISELIDSNKYSTTHIEIVPVVQAVLVSSITSTILGIILYAKNKTKEWFLLWLIISIILSVFFGFFIGTVFN